MIDQEKLRAVLKSANLTYREREVIKLRYALGDGYNYTLEETGRIFKVTRERIRQIESKALRKLGSISREQFESTIRAEETCCGKAGM